METTHNSLLTLHQNAAQLPGANWSWLQDLRNEAALAWLNTGYPTKKQEAWKYTSTYQLATEAFEAQVNRSDAMPAIDTQHALLKNAHQYHIYNGCWQASLTDTRSLPEGVTLMSFAKACEEQLISVSDLLGQTEENAHGFHALNTALMQDGFVLIVQKNIELTSPIQILYYHNENNAAYHIRNLILLEPNAKATVVETFLGASGTRAFTNVITEAVISEYANLTHIKYLQDSAASYHVGNLTMEVGLEATAVSFSLALDANWARSDTRVSLIDTRAHTELYGVYALSDTQHVDHHTEILHSAAHCQSKQHYRGLLSGSATGVFNGKIWVAPDASKCSAEQINQNLLLSKDATIHSKPELEIFNDDVKCSHGATVGQLDENSIFYLQSRGISKTDARLLLLEAFAGEIISSLTQPDIQEWLHAALTNKGLLGTTEDNNES